MVWDINHVILVGRLTKDPELTYTQNGKAVCRFSLAVSRSSGSSQDNQGDNTSYFNVVAWNKTAEICKEYLTKGKQVGVDGRLQQRRWAGQDGVRKNTIEIVVNNVQFFGPPRQGQDQFQTARSKPMAEPLPAEGFSEPSQGTEEGMEKDPYLSELDDDEIPF